MRLQCIQIVCIEFVYKAKFKEHITLYREELGELSVNERLFGIILHLFIKRSDAHAVNVRHLRFIFHDTIIAI